MSQTDFDCSHVGTNEVILTVTDVNGNQSTATATVTVEDDVDPETIDLITVLSSNATVECDGSGNAVDLQAWLDSNGGASATDACGPLVWSHDYNDGAKERSLWCNGLLYL